jgi:hypothetical protein
LNNKNYWSNLLAALMESDPSVTASLLGAGDSDDLVVEREVFCWSNRPDIIVRTAAGAWAGVIEVTVRSALGHRQLTRYEGLMPDAD